MAWLYRVKQRHGGSIDIGDATAGIGGKWARQHQHGGAVARYGGARRSAVMKRVSGNVA
jgi:hypothetical protein